ncbi:MAG: apolipoprotein N-acyltransferase [bacterium]
MRPVCVVVSLLSGLLAALAFPDWELWPLAWVALVPLFWALEALGPRQAATLGWMAGALHYGILLYWLVGTMQTYGRLPLVLAVAVMVLLVLYLAGFWALFCGLMSFLGKSLGFPAMVMAPALWVSLEVLRSIFLSGFPWALLGYSQWNLKPLVQVADLSGIYGVSFLLVSVNVGGYLLLRDLAKGRRPGLGCILGLVFCGALSAGAWLYGEQRISLISGLSTQAQGLRVGVAQGNMEQSIKWEPAFQEATLSRYEGLSRLVVEKGGAELVVWPETAAPFFFQREGPLRERLLGLASQLKADILFGSPAYGWVEEKRVFYNRAYLLGSEGGVRGWYDKIHLVPFGEYVPLQQMLPFVRKMVAAIGDFHPGQAPLPLVTSGGAAVGVSICFESIFPDIFREQVRKGADLLANLTNDAWFGKTAAPYQHLSMLAMRAVETRRWIVRAANTGISAFIDPCGRITSQTKLFETDSLVDRVSRLQVHSFYVLHGDLFAWACALWSAMLLCLALFRAHRRKDVVA